MRGWAWVLIAVLCAACDAPTRTAESPRAQVFCDEFCEPPTQGARTRQAESTEAAGVSSEPAPLAKRFETTVIGSSASGLEGSRAQRPARARRIDVSFKKAPFEDAARLLSDAGRFPLVLGDGTTGEVSLRLRDVEPFEALLLLAELRGLSIEVRRGVVMVGSSLPR